MAIIDVKGEAEGMYSVDTIELSVSFENRSAVKSDAINKTRNDMLLR